MDAVIFIGIQGAGKTSFYRERFFDTHVRISLDMLRTRHREQLLLDSCLLARQSSVVDNTNPLAADRQRYIVPARKAGFRVVAYLFRVPLQQAIERNDQRKFKQKVPVAALASTYKKLQPPSAGEGFDQIYTVELAGGEFVVT